MRGRERIDFALDGKQSGEKIIQMFRDFDEKLRLRFAIEKAGFYPRIRKLLRKARVDLLEEPQKALVEPLQSVTVIEIFEPEPESERQLFCRPEIQRCVALWIVTHDECGRCSRP